MRKLIWAFVFLLLCVVALLNLPYFGGPKLSTAEIDLNSGQVRARKLFLSIIPYSQKIEDTFVSQGSEIRAPREWMIFAANRPNMGVSYTFSAASIFSVDHLIDHNLLVFQNDSLDKIREELLKHWAAGDYDFHIYYLQYVEHHSFNRSRKSPPYYIITEQVLTKAKQDAINRLQ